MAVHSDNPPVGKRSSSPVDIGLPADQVNNRIDFLELAFEAIFVWNEADGITEWNHAAEKLYGYSRDEVLGRQPHELLRTTEIFGIDRLLDSEADGVRSGELRQVSRAGRELVIQCRRQTLRQGDRIVFVEVCRELSERRVSEKRVLKMLESIGDGFLSCDAKWRIIYLSSPAERILQIKREDVLGKNLWEAFPGAEGTLLETEFHRAAAGETRDFEYCYKPWQRWFHNRCFPRQGGGISVYFEDITDRKLAEQAMRESEERFRMTLSGGAVTVYEQDSNLRYLWIHPTDGFAGQMIGKTDLEISDDRDAQLHTDLKLYVLETGKSVKREVAALFRGRKRWYDLLVEPRFDGEGKVVGVVGTALDITERRQAEQALMESEERFR
ncbi:MAG TPA: PAS domain-containing protein, partial [Pyrinomonadaceae bacterium]|nr:PAS domain-containing protein [Pyrinomonadaceae bacterium]